MGRLGVRWDEAEKLASDLKVFGNLRVEGIMTHFASADEPAEDGFTHKQVKLFYETVELFRRSGHDPTFIDLANSPGAVVHPESRGNMVRLGGILYGLGRDVLPGGVPKPELKPVMSVTSAIANLKHVPKGETVGYGRTFTTERDSVIAAVPIGYHDGFRRGLSNKARVIIRGRFAPVVGRVSMDWTTVDVTDITDVASEDEVILIGEQNGLRIGAEDLAADLGTISYEITCGISRRVVRKYLSSISSTNEAA
jgi:alanine racemase